MLTSEVKQPGFRGPMKAKQGIAAMIEHLRRRILRQISKHGLDHDSEILVGIPATADVIG